MTGDLNQKLYVSALPPGVKFMILEVRPHIPSWQRDQGGLNSWAASFSDTNGRRAKEDKNGMTRIDESYEIPIVAGEHAYIGQVKFVPGSSLAPGECGWVKIKFQLQGTATSDGKSIAIDRSGFLTVTATDWGYLQRPDCALVTYNWSNEASETVKLEIPATISGMPDDLHFIFAVDPETKQIGLSSTTDKDFALKFTDTVLKGIFKLHEKLFGWVTGKVTG